MKHNYFSPDLSVFCLFCFCPSVKHVWDVECTENLTLIEEGAEQCRNPSGNWLVVILLMVYLLVTNILLINLLIAMFR